MSPQIGKEDIRKGDDEEEADERGDQRETLFNQKREALSEKDSPRQANNNNESDEKSLDEKYELPIEGDDNDREQVLDFEALQ